MYNAAFLTKCFDSIYYLQQGQGQIQKEALENVEEEKVQRNLDGLEKAGFSRNVFLFTP